MIPQVSPEWWTNLWLNEGFATYMSFVTVDQLTIEYDLWNDFANDMFLEALLLDALKSSHPVEVNIGQPAEIKETLDKLCRIKGAAIIRMLKKYLGEETFKSGLNAYLTSRQYKSGKADDLWNVFENISAKPIFAIMNSWTVIH